MVVVIYTFSFSFSSVCYSRNCANPKVAANTVLNTIILLGKLWFNSSAERLLLLGAHA